MKLELGNFYYNRNDAIVELVEKKALGKYPYKALLASGDSYYVDKNGRDLGDMTITGRDLVSEAGKVKKAIFTIGISASGKSTWAQQQAAYKVIDRDAIRREILAAHCDYNPKTQNMWHFWDFETMESECQILRELMFKEYVDAGRNIIFCDTNLKLPYVEDTCPIIQELLFRDYRVKYKKFPIALEEAQRRNSARLNSVNYTVIENQAKAYAELEKEYGK
jgi:predicted kinase